MTEIGVQLPEIGVQLRPKPVFNFLRKTHGGWTARCPAHDDRESSWFIRHEDEVRWRLDCRAGCTPEEIVGAIEIAVAELEPDQIVRNYYDGFYEVVRIGPEDFRQRRRDGTGGWTFDMTGVEPRLCRLQVLQEARSTQQGRAVIVVERGCGPYFKIECLRPAASAGSPSKRRQTLSRWLSFPTVTRRAGRMPMPSPARATRPGCGRSSKSRDKMLTRCGSAGHEIFVNC